MNGQVAGVIRVYVPFKISGLALTPFRVIEILTTPSLLVVISMDAELLVPSPKPLMDWPHAEAVAPTVPRFSASPMLNRHAGRSDPGP